jgi:hypothetical protein
MDASAARSGSVPGLREALATALRIPDTQAVRTIALESGLTPGRLYGAALRPALDEALRTCRDKLMRRLLTSTVESIVAESFCRWEVASRSGRGRAAVVLHGDGPFARFDAQVLADALDAHGWRSHIRPSRDGAAEDVRLSVSTGVEHPQAATATDVVDLACDFDGLGEVDALLCTVAERLGASADALAWGIRIARPVRDEIVVAPLGVLDEANADKLRVVLDSRRATLSRVTIDLRDVAVLAPAGRASLERWRCSAAEVGIASAVIGGEEDAA